VGIRLGSRQGRALDAAVVVTPGERRPARSDAWALIAHGTTGAIREGDHGDQAPAAESARHRPAGAGHVETELLDLGDRRVARNATVQRQPDERVHLRADGTVGSTADAEPPDREAVHVANGYRFFAGLRSDPHFKDVKGFQNDFQFTGDDPVARRNIFGIALEVPNADLGPAPMRLWARTMAPVHGAVTQVDQAGRPGINNTFNEPEEDRLAFNETPPADQRARFGDKFLAFLRSLGYSDSEASDLVPSFLPDVLEYDPSSPRGYPNGRRLTDDTADLLAALLTRGRITSDGVGPHKDLLDEFPYLGATHPAEES
jgi:hypothetical protein